MPKEVIDPILYAPGVYQHYANKLFYYVLGQVSNQSSIGNEIPDVAYIALYESKGDDLFLFRRTIENFTEVIDSHPYGINPKSVRRFTRVAWVEVDIEDKYKEMIDSFQRVYHVGEKHEQMVSSFRNTYYKTLTEPDVVSQHEVLELEKRRVSSVENQTEALISFTKATKEQIEQGAKHPRYEYYRQSGKLESNYQPIPPKDESRRPNPNPWEIYHVYEGERHTAYHWRRLLGD